MKKKERPTQIKKNATSGSGRWGRGQPARKDYEYRARPASLDARPRSDGRGTRYPVTVTLDDACGLTVLDRRGRQIDGRMAVVKEAKNVLAQIVQELGGPAQITFRQRLQLEVVMRRVIVSRHTFERELMADDSSAPSLVGIASDRVLLQALQQVYR